MTTATPRRCAWSGERSERAIEVSVPNVDRLGRRRGTVTVPVLPEHEAALRAHADLVSRYGTTFLVTVVVIGSASFALALASGVDGWRTWTIPVSGVLVGLMGLVFVALPFTTPETSAFFGLRRSIRIARFLGLLLLGLGVAIVVIG